MLSHNQRGIVQTGTRMSFWAWEGGASEQDPARGEDPRNGERERRAKRRFQVEQDVRYKMLYGQRIAETGSGKTANISSGGVWFTTESMLTTGMPVEVSMNWPVLLNEILPHETNDLRVRDPQQ